MKKLSTYIFENSNQSNFKKLFEIAKQQKLRGAHQYDQLNFPKTWKEFDYKKKSNIKMLEATRCYWNAIQIAKEQNIQLCCGVAILFNEWFNDDYNQIVSNKNSLVKPFYYVFPHAWNIENKQIIDVTLTDSKDYAYFGEIVDVNDFKDGKELLNYVNKQLQR